MLFSFMENVHRIAEPDYLPLTGALIKFKSLIDWL